MKMFRIKGGIHPDERKDLAAGKAIETVPLPSLLRIPLQQHIGAPAVTVVEKGDEVKKGQVLASARGPVSAAIHAPTSGRISAIGRFVAPHPSGLPGQTITMRPDGKDEWGELPAPIEDPFAVEPDVIAERVAASGIVGMGGATFPSAVKLGLRNRNKLETLVINAAECEPYLTCDDRMMRERSEAVIDGIRILRHALGVERAIIAIEGNKPEALAALKAVCSANQFKDVLIARVPTRYPMGSEKHLVQTLTGKETPARALTADIGVVVHNVATCYAIREAVRFGRPLISRIVTVSGGAMKRTGNFEVPIGTPISHLIDHCDGFNKEPDRLLLGGPMMGQPIASTRTSIVKGSNGVLALCPDETPARQTMPCIRCASCVSACPCGLTPFEMAGHIRKEELDAAVKIGLLDCIACGSCAWVCPASIPLVQYFNYAKGKLTAQQRAKHKQEETKRLTQFREERMERQKRAKQEAMARMKAEREAKKKAEAEKKRAKQETIGA
ncbi:electron transport complex protein RnfC [Rhodobium orientis]|uniref:Ion-translocating oxidoreductase complex subunit C n=1 Tax=Rhodobium orientis TaxID=34017 RepID=A0A327JKD7_9HYPH|nr:electron transport complex subunit RsxC [Rhodobium orientis]MBB4304367.1 electron transport complex protein RnfC [Rhodobium orientis]MBK5951973.1 electron transport complex subunit RsxC [Rhodobium orientis]RAI25753.1 electron transport complex subunit RsxC [Rhodobium orientis]